MRLCDTARGTLPVQVRSVWRLGLKFLTERTTRRRDSPTNCVVFVFRSPFKARPIKRHLHYFDLLWTCCTAICCTTSLQIILQQVEASAVWTYRSASRLKARPITCTYVLPVAPGRLVTSSESRTTSLVSSWSSFTSHLHHRVNVIEWGQVTSTCSGLMYTMSQKMTTVISQGSVATRLRCGGHCDSQFLANFLTNSTMEKFRKSVNICQSYGQKYRGPFLTHGVQTRKSNLRKIRENLKNMIYKQSQEKLTKSVRKT